jgi:hypothetical protein
VKCENVDANPVDACDELSMLRFEAGVKRPIFWKKGFDIPYFYHVVVRNERNFCQKGKIENEKPR